jgi:hypothetical protein
VTAAQGLTEIGQRHPEACAHCIAALTATLERFEELDLDVNACLASTLLDLEAVEAVPLMKRTFDADRVAEGVAGRLGGGTVRAGPT